MDHNIRHLMEFWDLSLDATLMKIARIIQKDPDYYLSFYDPILVVKKSVIYNKKYIVEKTLELDKHNNLISSKQFRQSVPRISIRNNKSKVKYLRFSTGFFHKIFGEKIPIYAKMNLIENNIIRIEFSNKKGDGFLNITKPSKDSRFYGQLSINGFMNYYCLKISDLEGIYEADIGFKQDMINTNLFYLYIDKRER
jgi:hypothetical protein